ncbi:Uncharacterized protein Adt_43679 [Abeliophyllum distichum]|uniref:Uncharacterized protein n=1 Tax=Abeliophyllum distichum TaxID=126358 RepID=A0ABD1P9E5_9LAMI
MAESREELRNSRWVCGSLRIVKSRTHFAFRIRALFPFAFKASTLERSVLCTRPAPNAERAKRRQCVSSTVVSHCLTFWDQPPSPSSYCAWHCTDRQSFLAVYYYWSFLKCIFL